MITSLDRRSYSLNDFVGKDTWVRVYRKRSTFQYYIKVLRIYGKFDADAGMHITCVDYRAVLAVLIDTNTLLEKDDPYIERVWTSDLDNIELISPLEILSDDEVTRMFT